MKSRTRASKGSGYTKRIYDETGKHVRTTRYDSNGNIKGDIHYEHNEFDDAIAWKIYDGEGVMTSRYEVDYYSPRLESEVQEAASISSQRAQSDPPINIRNMIQHGIFKTSWRSSKALKEDVFILEKIECKNYSVEDRIKK